MPGNTLVHFYVPRCTRNVARVSEEAKVDINSEDYVNSFTASMMEATYAWSNGAKFNEVHNT